MQQTTATPKRLLTRNGLIAWVICEVAVLMQWSSGSKLAGYAFVLGILVTMVLAAIDWVRTAE